MGDPPYLIEWPALGLLSMVRQGFPCANLPAVRSLSRWARRLVDLFPFTGLGLLLGAATAAALSYFAYRELDLVLLVVGYGAIGLALLATLFVLIGVVLTRMRVDPGARRELAFETGRAYPTGFTLPSLRWLPLVRVQWSWVTPPRCEVEAEHRGGRLVEWVRARERGLHSEVTRRVWVEDVFGLARLGLWMTHPIELYVLPHVGALGRLPTLISMAGGEDWPHPMGVAEGDRVELRRYAPGDPARLIHWKVFARTQKLVVRMPERALQRADRTVAYLVAGQGDEASAAAARVAVETQALGDDWVFGADGAARGTQRLADARDAIVRSAERRDQGGAELETFLRREERRGPMSLVLFAPPTPGPWVGRVQAALRSHRGPVRVVIGVDGLAPEDERTWWRRLLTRAPRQQRSSAAALDAVVEALRDPRVEIVVVDRSSGRVLGEAHRRAARQGGRALERAA